MKKSDKKQYEKAWDCFNEGWTAFMSAMLLMDELDESDYSIDDLNQMGGRMLKLAATINRIYDDKRDFIEKGRIEY